MVDLSLEEAQLYRLLADFFGRDRIVLQMSVLAVCGGAVPDLRPEKQLPEFPADLKGWAKGNRCLFTIVDDDDSPKMVIDFEALDSGTVDIGRIEFQRLARPLLDAAGIRFFTITNDEFAELLNPSGQLDIFSFFRDRFEELGFAIGPCQE